MRRYVAVKPTNKAGVPSWRSQWSEASHPRGNRAVPHVPDSVPDFARPRDESVTAAGRLADLLTSCAAARPKGGAGCVSAHVRICPGPPGKPGGYRDEADVLFTDAELEMLRVYSRRYSLVELTNLASAILLVAMMGGYMNRKHDPPPGHTVMWRGYGRLQIRAVAYEELGAFYDLVERPPP